MDNSNDFKIYGDLLIAFHKQKSVQLYRALKAMLENYTAKCKADIAAAALIEADNKQLAWDNSEAGIAAYNEEVTKKDIVTFSRLY